MRVICVNKIDDPEKGMENVPRPEVGDDDIVIGDWRAYGTLYYILERFGENYGYKASCFAIRPDLAIEELEQLEEKLEPELVKG